MPDRPAREPAYLVGTITRDGRPAPFRLDLDRGTLELGEYTHADPAQHTLETDRLEQLRGRIEQAAGVAAGDIVLGQYFCSSCRCWTCASAQQWSLTICVSCSLDRGSELREYYS